MYCAIVDGTWWRHQMVMFSVLLALCKGNPPVTNDLRRHCGHHDVTVMLILLNIYMDEKPILKLCSFLALPRPSLPRCCGLQSNDNNRIKCSWIIYAMQHVTSQSLIIFIPFIVWNSYIWDDFTSFRRNFIPTWIQKHPPVILFALWARAWKLSSYVVSLSGAHFTKHFSLSVKFSEIVVALIQVLWTWSLQNRAHNMTGVIACHVQMFLATWLPGLKILQKLYDVFEFWHWFLVHLFRWDQIVYHPNSDSDTGHTKMNSRIYQVSYFRKSLFLVCISASNLAKCNYWSILQLQRRFG